MKKRSRILVVRNVIILFLLFFYIWQDQKIDRNEMREQIKMLRHSKHLKTHLDKILRHLNDKSDQLLQLIELRNMYNHKNHHQDLVILTLHKDETEISRQEELNEWIEFHRDRVLNLSLHKQLKNLER